VADTIFHILTDFFSRYGYSAVFFGVMLENAGLPVPGETVLIFAGFLAYHGELRLVRAILTAIAGATIGDSLGYCLGRYGGTAFIEKHRQQLGFLAREFDRSRTIYLQYGQWAVFTARFIVGLRMFSGILAGSFRMRYLRFLAFDLTGAVIWATTIACVAFFFGSNWQRLVQVVKEFDWVVLGIIGIGVAVAAIAYYRRRRRFTG
jgi:membrane protein DedA with SNARE-associated domain